MIAPALEVNGEISGLLPFRTRARFVGWLAAP
jgi:hypothetical protein